MMMLVSEPECRQQDHNFQNDLEQIPPQYRGWRITTKVINGKLWLRWQHPKESFPRYGCPIQQNDIASSINHARFLIDLSIKLEEEASKRKQRN